MGYDQEEEVEEDNQQYEFEWECLIDANCTFGENNNNSGKENPSTINCLFTRVYIDDIDLVNMGDDDAVYVEEKEEKEVQTTSDDLISKNDAEKSESNEESSTTSAEKQTTDEEVQEPEKQREVEPPDHWNAMKKWNAASTSIPKAFKGRCVDNQQKKKKDDRAVEQQLLEDSKELQKWKQAKARKRRCADFQWRLKRLNFAPGLFGDNGQQDDGSIVDSDILTDVSFMPYPSAHEPKKMIRYHKQKHPDNEEGQEVGAVPATSSSTDVADWKPDEFLTKKDEFTSLWTHKIFLCQEELRNFDFNYDEHRDQVLVAKNAKKYFANDRAMMKYWFQRYRFFSKLDKGILMDREGWFSVTPEKLAKHVAERMVRVPDCILLDAFTGMGGNAIQFALRGAYVIAVDIDPLKLRCALQNARVYGVSSRINFICANFFHVADSMFGIRIDKDSGQVVESERNCGNAVAQSPTMVDAVYLSPPWGGPEYAAQKSFDLEAHMDPNGKHIFRVAQRISPNIAYFLPKHTRTDQLIALAGPGGRVELEQTMINEKLKSIHAYYGQIAANE